MVFENLRKELTLRHKALREALETGQDASEVKALFLLLHGSLHGQHVAPASSWSYEDLLLEGLSEKDFRAIPGGQEHSVVWVVWHMSRIEDVTMNLLVAGRDQVFEEGGWFAKTRSPVKHTGNGAGLTDVEAFSRVVEINALRDYRYAVGKRTREVVSELTCEDFLREVVPDHIQRIIDEGAVDRAGMDVVDYWGRRNVTGLLLMPPTRHVIVHWNEVRELTACLR